MADLFTPKLKIHREKFREYCERLIFSEPLLFGHKAEELLWRKCYYDVVATAKKLKKRDEHIANIESHINAAVGYYHHYIAKLEGDYDLNLGGLVDFGLCAAGKTGEVTGEEVKRWARESVHRCLIYLGDLCRYKLDIYPNWDASLAIRYYSQALYLNSDHGMPHNQMGTLATAQNRSLDAIYHYMHCLACKVSFEGTENNLQRLFEKNSQFLEKLPTDDDSEQTDKADHIKQMLARFFLLIDVWYFEKNIPHIYNLCHKTYIDFEECLAYYKPVASESDDDSDVSGGSLAYVTCDSVFKIVVICLLCITKLQKRHSNHLSTVIAFTLAIYSQLIQNVISHLQQAIMSFPLPKKLKKIHLRRRRKSLGGSDSEDDDDADVIIIDSSDESLSSDDDDDEDVQLCSSDEEEKQEKPADDSTTTIKKLKLINPTDVLEMIAEENFLQSIKIISDWLMFEEDVLKSCSKSSTTLLRQLTYLLNLLNVDFAGKHDDLAAIGLPEDVLLKGVAIFSASQKGIAWNQVHKSSMSVKEEFVVRVQKIVAFGKHLTTVKETGISYDGEKKLFVCEAESGEEKMPTITFEELVSLLERLICRSTFSSTFYYLVLEVLLFLECIWYFTQLYPEVRIGITAKYRGLIPSMFILFYLLNVLNCISVLHQDYSCKQSKQIYVDDTILAILKDQINWTLIIFNDSHERDRTVTPISFF